MKRPEYQEFGHILMGFLVRYPSTALFMKPSFLSRSQVSQTIYQEKICPKPIHAENKYNIHIHPRGKLPYIADREDTVTVSNTAFHWEVILCQLRRNTTMTVPLSSLTVSSSLPLLQFPITHLILSQSYPFFTTTLHTNPIKAFLCPFTRPKLNDI